MQFIELDSIISPKGISNTKILFPTVFNRKEMEECFGPQAASSVLTMDLRSINKIQATLSCPYLTTFAVSPLVTDLPIPQGNNLSESETKKLQITHQLISDPLVVVKALGSHEAEPYQLSVLRDEDRTFFDQPREGFQSIYDYVNASTEALEQKIDNDAAAVALLSFVRQTPALLSLDWMNAPKQRTINHEVLGPYADANLMSVVNYLVTDFAARRGVPYENYEALKSPVLMNAAMRASANASAVARTPIFSPEALDKLVEWCCDTNPAKAAMAEFDKNKSKDKEKNRTSKQATPSFQDLVKTTQLMLKFMGASTDVSLHARNGFLSTNDNVRLSPLIFARGSKIGFASEWFHSIRAASFDRNDRRDDRPARFSGRDNREGRPRSRDRNDKK